MQSKKSKAKVTPVRQRTQYTCMATSLSMCLKALGYDLTEDEVNRVMGARPMKGARWEEAFAAAQHFGARATLVTPCTVQALKEWTDKEIPVMISWNPEKRDWSHASVVFDVVDKDGTLMVHVADPNIPNPTETVRVMSEDEFYGKWAEAWDNYMVRRVAMAVEREITPEGRQVQASAGRWERLSKGGQKFITDEIMCWVTPEDTWDTVRDRDIPDLYEVADPELLADGIPELVKMYQNAENDHAKWVRQGWWPKPVKVQKWKIYIMTRRPTVKNFESDYFKSEREALKMAEKAIPIIEASKRPRWMKPASTIAGRKGKRPQRVNAPKDPREKLRIKVKPGTQRNEEAKFLAENRGYGNPGAHKNKGKRKEGPMRQRKHKQKWDREGGAEESRWSVYSPEKGDGLTQPLSTRPDYGSEESFAMNVNEMKNALADKETPQQPTLDTNEFAARLAFQPDDIADMMVEALRKLRIKARKKNGRSVSVNGLEFFKQGIVLDGGLQYPNHLQVSIPWNRSVSEYDAMVEWANKAALEIAKYLKKNKLASTKTARINPKYQKLIMDAFDNWGNDWMDEKEPATQMKGFSSWNRKVDNLLRWSETVEAMARKGLIETKPDTRPGNEGLVLIRKKASTKTADAEKNFKKPHHQVHENEGVEVKDVDEAGVDAKEAKFEKGKPADPTENMTEEQKKKWMEHHGQIGNKKASDIERLLTAALEVKKLQGKGLYGYTLGTQRTVEATIRKATRRAAKIAKALYKKDSRTAMFLGTHAKRSKSASARILVACMKDLGPKVAAEMDKTAGLGMYGMNTKVARLALAACTDVTEMMGQVAYDLHARKANRHERITGFLKNHSKSARCLYAKMLLASYPDAAATILTAEEKTADKCDNMPNEAMVQNCKDMKDGKKPGKSKSKSKKKDDGKMPPEVLEKFKAKKKATPENPTRSRLTTKLAESGLPANAEGEEPKSGFPGVEESEEAQPDMSQHGYDPGQTKNAMLMQLAKALTKIMAGEDSSSMPGDEEGDAAQPEAKGYEVGEVKEDGYDPGEVKKKAMVRVVELSEGDLIWLED